MRWQLRQMIELFERLRAKTYRKDRRRALQSCTASSRRGPGTKKNVQRLGARHVADRTGGGPVARRSIRSAESCVGSRLETFVHKFVGWSRRLRKCRGKNNHHRRHALHLVLFSNRVIRLRINIATYLRSPTTCDSSNNFWLFLSLAVLPWDDAARLGCSSTGLFWRDFAARWRGWGAVPAGALATLGSLTVSFMKAILKTYLTRQCDWLKGGGRALSIGSLRSTFTRDRLWADIIS